MLCDQQDGNCDGGCTALGGTWNGKADLHDGKGKAADPGPGTLCCPEAQQIEGPPAQHGWPLQACIWSNKDEEQQDGTAFQQMTRLIKGLIGLQRQILSGCEGHDIPLSR